jgi:hypothetical protein
MRALRGARRSNGVLKGVLKDSVGVLRDGVGVLGKVGHCSSTTKKDGMWAS